MQLFRGDNEQYGCLAHGVSKYFGGIVVDTHEDDVRDKIVSKNFSRR